jgi:hypothetical protein
VRLWADGTPRPVAPPWVAHALAVADVAEHLLVSRYHGGAAAWHTERELARGAVPVLERGPRPDGVLTLTTPDGSALHMAVEVELTPKPAADYPTKVARYDRLLADGVLARVRWYVGDDGTRRVVERALRSAEAPATITVEPLPK